MICILIDKSLILNKIYFSKINQIKSHQYIYLNSFLSILKLFSHSVHTCILFCMIFRKKTYHRHKIFRISICAILVFHNFRKSIVGELCLTMPRGKLGKAGES